MTKDEVMRLAREAGARFNPKWGFAYSCDTDTFERFANLVAKHTQEQCAKVVDGMAKEAPFVEEECAYEKAAIAIRTTTV